MHKPRRNLLFALALCLFITAGPVAQADPVVDFFRRVGDTLANGGKRQEARRAAKAKQSKVRPRSRIASSSPTPSPAAPNVSPAPSPGGSPVATPEPVMRAEVAPFMRGGRRDLRYGIPVPDREGLVRSPWSPNEGLVDVSGFSSGTEVKDPFTGKVFLTP